MHPDLGHLTGHRGGPPSRSPSTPHSSSRAPTMPCSTMILGSCSVGQLDRRAPDVDGSSTLLMPRLEPPRAGLTNSGYGKAATASRQAAGSRAPLGGGDRHERADRQPVGGEDQLREVLVHADRAGQHAGADVAGAHHLEQALDGAVLAERPVQQGDRYVHRAQSVQAPTPGVRPAPSPTGPRISTASWASSVSSGSRPSVTAKLRDGVRIDHDPAARPGDADPDHVVAVPVQRPDHPGGRQAGHRVLAARSAEHHGDPGSGRRGGRGGRRGLSHDPRP